MLEPQIGTLSLTAREMIVLVSLLAGGKAMATHDARATIIATVMNRKLLTLPDAESLRVKIAEASKALDGLSPQAWAELMNLDDGQSNVEVVLNAMSPPVSRA